MTELLELVTRAKTAVIVFNDVEKRLDAANAAVETVSVEWSKARDAMTEANKAVLDYIRSSVNGRD